LTIAFIVGQVYRWLLDSKSRSFLCVILSLGIVPCAHAQAIHFPNAGSQTISPDHRYVIRNVDHESSEPAHDLVLIDKRSGTETKIHSYDRHVDILWSPRSDAFTINDYEGSDSAKPLLCALPWTNRKADLLGDLTEFLRRQHKEDLVLKNDHVYFTVRRWVNSRELLCRLEAYGQASPRGSGFQGLYIYRIGQGFRSYHPKVSKD
jgi:hypothetical protein